MDYDEPLKIFHLGIPNITLFYENLKAAEQTLEVHDYKKGLSWHYSQCLKLEPPANAWGTLEIPRLGNNGP